ncbi:chemotaxis protein CheW [Pseudomonas gingeri]|uniref:Chemotaxis protein CheW n=1 Tax=Pseudomonas gingeri TaxID=117681 RepID=A0A7Y7YH67_9PSED|nr:chemotaxis protein CheW [Pseudomonas gingeri]NWB31346.1 chemotaxis protein CheW [Pseudomonas gingeri]NWC35789.1 chemotaxis protein CheW [Pseudomonas gingeri]NWD06331.1 chemotaxis protein CheW [Pseudomonas gingeri]NWE32830.1 chemotaxis protein CheW [Pseudomonas gingeri]NWE60443.1 chemotaxis protein CheW [Pseudomonas gingeri]
MTPAVITGVSEPRTHIPGEGEPSQFLTFMSAREIYAIDTLCVREIIEYGQVTHVPMMPRFVRGVINLRGSVVPVIDLRARFDRGTTQQGNRTCIVILEVLQEGESQVLGIVVDSVSEVIEIDLADIKPAPVIGNRIREDFIRGMVRVRGEFLTLLQVDRVLCVSEIAGLLR